MSNENDALLSRLHERLGPEAGRALREMLSEARARRLPVYLVGGSVRDLLLDAEHVDLDLVVEGETAGLAEALAGALAARAVTHPRFGTAVVRGEGFRIDLARARAERYERPGALPSVQPATLADDLARRDFTMNALAMRLDGADAGALIDPHGGRRDVAGRLVRVLHDGSFRDDATRILRALRYAGRLEFAIEPHTEALLRRDLSYLDTISGARLRRELEAIARETDAATIIGRCAELGALAAVHDALRVLERTTRAAARLSALEPAHRDAVLFCVLLAGATAGEMERAAARLALTGRQAEALRALRALLEREAALARPSLRPSQAVRLLENAPAPAIEALALITDQPAVAGRARRYLDTWRSMRPRLNGRDLEALGVPRGPDIGVALAMLRDARLDGAVRTKEDEAVLVRERFLSKSPAAVGNGGRGG